MKKSFAFVLIELTSMFAFCYSQTSKDSISINNKKNFPTEIKGYIGLAHPFYTWSLDGNQQNFKSYYLVGNPWGINIWKSKRFGFSFEFVPFVKSTSEETKVTNFVFHPGILYRLGKDFTLIGRLAFETSGRYGITPIISKVLIRKQKSNFFTSIVLPCRVGNDHSFSFSTTLQIGIGF